MLRFYSSLGGERSFGIEYISSIFYNVSEVTAVFLPSLFHPTFYLLFISDCFFFNGALWGMPQPDARKE